MDNAFEPSNNQRQVFLSHRYLPKYLSWNVSAGYFVSSRKEHTFRWLLVWNTDNLKIPSDRIIFRPFRSFFQFNSILIFSDLLFLSQERGTCFWLSLLYLLGKKNRCRREQRSSDDHHKSYKKFESSLLFWILDSDLDLNRSCTAWLFDQGKSKDGWFEQMWSFVTLNPCRKRML